MEIFWHSLLIGCVFTVTVCSSEDAVQKRASDEYEDEIAAAEDHEHHRIIIVVPKEVPHHVNHVHTYKLGDKGIPLIHSGKVVHDHRHDGKVAHEHGHAGKSVHSHKHAGIYGHRHNHAGYLGHQHFGTVDRPHKQQSSYDRDRPLKLHTAAHKFHLEHQQLLHRKLQQQRQLKEASDYLVQQHGNGGGSSGTAGVGAAPFWQGAGRRPVSGHVQFVPSSQPRGLGSFMPAEIQQYVGGQHGVVFQQQQYVTDDGRAGPPAAYNVVQLRVPDQNGPNVVKHVDIDLANNVAKLQTVGKLKQPVATNFKTVTQYNRVIGHGRAVPTAEEEFDDDIGGGVLGDELSVEDAGYRFGDGYRLAVNTAGDEFSAAQEQDEEEADEFKEPAGDGVGGDDDDASDGNAYSQAYVQF